MTLPQSQEKCHREKPYRCIWKQGKNTQFVVLKITHLASYDKFKTCGHRSCHYCRTCNEPWCLPKSWKRWQGSEVLGRCPTCGGYLVQGKQAPLGNKNRLANHPGDSASRTSRAVFRQTWQTASLLGPELNSRHRGSGTLICNSSHPALGKNRREIVIFPSLCQHRGVNYCANTGVSVTVSTQRNNLRYQKKLVSYLVNTRVWLLCPHRGGVY